MSKLNIKIVPKMIFTLLVLTVISLLLYINMTKRVDSYNELSMELYKQNSFDRIYSEMQIFRTQANEQVKEIAKTIEKELLESGNLDQFQIDMDNGTINKEMYNIIKDNIKDKSLNNINNFRNGVLVMTYKGIYEDFNYDRASNKIRTWEHELESSYNKFLEKDAFSKILNHSNDLIIIEHNNRISKEHMLLSEASYEGLKNIYFNEGLEGLINYQIIVPAYITETGDIFGQDDIKQGIKNDNHKIIIAQEFNLYDQILKNDPDIFNIEENMNTINHDGIMTKNFIYITSLVGLINTVVLIFYITEIYNRYINEKENNKK